MAAELIRVFSDIHFGDRASRVRNLAQLKPLFSDVDRIVCNGDTVDSRPGPHPAHTADCVERVGAFINANSAPTVLLTGNHDPDVSTSHSLELLGGEILVLHGDVLFDDIVPWGRDAYRIRAKIDERVGKHPAARDHLSLEERSRIWREVAASVPQRHQSERRRINYAKHFVLDTIWPPTRFLRIINAWRTEPKRAAALLRQHRPRARFILLGHTHRPLVRTLPGGPVVINTGSFCPPFGGYVVDIQPPVLRVRRIEAGTEFRAGRIVAEFPLANR